MIKKISLLLSLVCFFANAHVDPDPGEQLYRNIKKIDNDLYFAKIPGKPLYLAMERITDKNFRNWQEYARIQQNPRSILSAQNVLRGRQSNQTFTSDGSYHFSLVFNKVPIDKNEVWVAYITANAKPQHIAYISEDGADKLDKLEEFISKNKDNPGAVQSLLQGSFEDNIKMFVTVTSSPKALISSHMGISTSIQGIMLGDHKGLSMYLHSFGAQVMKRRNPERRYMMNAPTAVMAQIIAKNLPKGSVFVGTREQEELWAVKHKEITAWEETHGKVSPPSFEEFVKSDPHAQLEALRYAKQMAEEQLQDKIKTINDECEETARETGRALIDCQEEFMKDTKLKFFPQIKSQRQLKNIHYNVSVEINSSGDLQFTKDYYTSLLNQEKTFYEKYFLEKRFRKVYPLHPMEGDTHHRNWIALMPGNPSILSVQPGTKLGNYFTIYESPSSQKPWLHVERGDPHYNWVFTEPFQPAGNTWYIVADLKALADVAPLEALPAIS